MICYNCNASKEIKNTFGCCCDRFHNAWEDIKHEFFKIFKDDYQPKYQCRFADLVDHPTEKNETERQIQTAKTMIEKMVSCYDQTEKGGASDCKN